MRALLPELMRRRLGRGAVILELIQQPVAPPVLKAASIVFNSAPSAQEFHVPDCTSWRNEAVFKTMGFPKINRTRIFTIGTLVALSIGLVGCETMKSGGSRSAFTFDPPMQTPKNPAAVKVKLSTTAQRLYVVEGDNVLLATPITVGTSSTPTPLGNFTIYSKQENRRRYSSPGAGYPMPYWMEFKSAYGMHWGFVKSQPATHGCVRMPLNSARKVFSLVRTGTPLEIARTQPWDATIGKSLPVLDDSHLPNPPLSYMLSPKVLSDAKQGKMWNF